VHLQKPYCESYDCDPLVLCQQCNVAKQEGFKADVKNGATTRLSAAYSNTINKNIILFSSGVVFADLRILCSDCGFELWIWQ